MALPAGLFAIAGAKGRPASRYSALLASNLDVCCPAPAALDSTRPYIGIFFIAIPDHADKPRGLFVGIVVMRGRKTTIQIDVCRVIAAIAYANRVRVLGEPARAEQCGQAQT